jgi:hypothetical protein
LWLTEPIAPTGEALAAALERDEWNPKSALPTHALAILNTSVRIASTRWPIPGSIVSPLSPTI